MKVIKFLLLSLILGLCLPLFGLISPSRGSASSIDPTIWQSSSTGLSVSQNDQHKTAGLGFHVKAESWPFISLQGGVKGIGGGYFAGPVGIDLGTITIPNQGSASLASESTDWSHNELTFSASTSQMKLWVSRLTPAILLQTTSSIVRFLSGNLNGYLLDKENVVTRPTAPVYPKYIAFSSNGNVKVRSLSESSIPLSIDQNWMLVWYGNNSHFVDTKAPLSYAIGQWLWPSLPVRYAYQADAPLLLVFQNKPTSIKNSPEGGVELSFQAGAGYITLLPLFGKEHLENVETESWSTGLPEAVLQRVAWWASHLCYFPEKVTESYAYNRDVDKVTITEDINFLNVCSGGTRFAPIPPILGVAKTRLNVTFSGAVIDGNLPTEFGPTQGIENTNIYTWSIDNLKKYIDGKRIIPNTAQAPPELEQELSFQVNKVIQAGHFSPWIFIDNVPNGDYRGDLYWANPGDIIYQLSEVAEALPNNLREDLIQYIKMERITYPPEDIYDLSLSEGTQRENYSYITPETLSIWKNIRKDVHLKNVPLYNFLALSKYYELTGENIPSQVELKALDVLNREMRERDWANFYWFKGFEDRRVAVINANRHFAGLLGFTRITKMAGDEEAEGLGRALLAKAAVLRLAMMEFPHYLYLNNLIELPNEPDWQVKLTAGQWTGYIFNYDWTGPEDDARQVSMLDQFGVYLYDHSGFMELGTDYRDWDKGPCSAFLTAYRDMVPELARFLSDTAPNEVEIYINKVTTLSPGWYRAFSQALFGAEHNLNHPMDSYQIFLAKVYLGKATPHELTDFLDISWLNAGDFFYMHKLAETIKAYNGAVWNNSINLRAKPGNKSIQLTWDIFVSLSPEVIWRIEYTGPTGDQASPITGLPSLTRSFTLTGLTNLSRYSIQVKAILNGEVIMTSDSVTVVPAEHIRYFPILLNGY